AAAISGRGTGSPGADGADALQESSSKGHLFVAKLSAGGLEGCSPLQPLFPEKPPVYPAPTERRPSRGWSSNGHLFVAKLSAGGLESCSPLQPRCAGISIIFAAPTERTPSRGWSSKGHLFVAKLSAGGLEGCGPSQPWPAVNQYHSTAP